MKARTVSTAGALALAFSMLTVAGLASALSMGPGTMNSAPVWTDPGDKEVNEGNLLAFWATATDPDGDALTYASPNLPAGATYSTAGRFRWTPEHDQSGTYHVRLDASDGNATSYQWITITVHHVNVAPEIEHPGSFEVDEGSLLRFWMSASDFDGDAVTWSSPNLPEGAHLRASDGRFRWVPDYDQSGTHRVRIDATDGTDTSSVYVWIAVNHVNLPPTLDPIGTQSVNEADQLRFTVTASDFDADDLTLSATDLPDGAVFRPWNGIFTWTPGYEQSGTYFATFSVSDGNVTVSETVEFKVFNTNRLPVLDDLGDHRVKSKDTVTFTATATDADGETLTFGLGAGAPAAATLDPATGEFSWTTTSADSGRWLFEVTVTDGLDTVVGLANVTVGDINKGPDLTFTPVLQDGGAVSPGDAVSATFTLVNNAAWTEAITISPSGPGAWDVSVDDAGIFYLGPGESKDLTLTVIPDASRLDGRAAMQAVTAWGPGAHAFIDVTLPVTLDVALDKAAFTMDEPVTGTVTATFANGDAAGGLAVTVKERSDVGFSRFAYVTLDAAGAAAFAFPQDATASNMPGAHSVTGSVDDATNAESMDTETYEVASPLTGVAALLPFLVIPAGALRRFR